MRRWGAVWGALVLLAGVVLAQPSLTIENYFLVSRSEMALTLQDTPARARMGTATVRCGNADFATAEFQQERDEPRVAIKLPRPLPAASACEVMLGSAGVAPGRLAFTTSPELRVVKEKLPGRFGLRIVLRGNYLVDLRKSADYEVFEMTLDPRAPGPEGTGGAPPFYRRTRIPDTRLAKLAGEGMIAIYFPSVRMTRSDPVVWVRNILSVLGEELVLKDVAALQLPMAPKGKDQAYGYAAVSHYAGPRIRPGTALDAKFNPLLTRKWGFLQGPNLTADLVWNAIPNLKSNDRVQLGWRGERFFRFLPERLTHDDPFLAGVRLTPTGYFETNRLRTQRNAVAEAKLTWLFRDLYRPKAERTRREYLNAVAALPPGTPAPPAASVRQAFWGYTASFESGVETGRAIDDVTVKASDKSGKIVVPSYAIFRPKGHVNVSVEFWRMSLEGFAEFRYLAAAENVYRETFIGRTVQSVERMMGIKPAFEARLRYRIDPLGHYQIETSLKNGALPPGFVYANFYRSGVVIQY